MTTWRLVIEGVGELPVVEALARELIEDLGDRSQLVKGGTLEAREAGKWGKPAEL
jgi:hypothetical protein